MKLTLIQLEGRCLSDFSQTASHILDLLEKCGQIDTDLILLPECAYPGYFLGLDEKNSWKTELENFEYKIRTLAGKLGKYIGIGLPHEAGGRLYNTLCLYDRTGRLVQMAEKSNLWHFDSNWFEPGRNFGVLETEFGTIGCMVCADGRIPEIARILRLQGAKLILDAVNLVASASEPAKLSNQQYTFILKERARENGVYLAVCDKCGVEDSCVTMLGRSMILSPNGEILAECSSEHEEILTCEIQLDEEYPIHSRKPDEYDLLTCATEQLPIQAELKKTLPLSDMECYTALIRYPWTNEKEYLKQAEHTLIMSQKANCRLAVLPYAAGLELKTFLPELNDLLLPGRAALIGYKSHRAALLRYGQPPMFTDDCIESRLLPVFEGVNLAVLFEDEMEIPENPRVCMLAGADAVAWFDTDCRSYYQSLMQTRSAENKIFTLRSTICDHNDYSLLINPDGGIVCTTFCCTEQTVFGMIYTAISRCKTVVPGTDIITSRIPNAYGKLTE